MSLPIDFNTYTDPDELLSIASQAATRAAQIELEKTNRKTRVKEQAAAELTRLETAVANYKTLLGAATVANSIRSTMGTTEEVAGTTSLRALRKQSNTDVVTAESVKALIKMVLELAQRQIDLAQEGRAVAAQTLRLGMSVTDELDHVVDTTL